MAVRVISAILAGGLLFSAASAIPPAQAQGLRAVRPLDGYVCKKLNITEREAMSASGGVSIRSAPSASAPPAALAPSVLLARSPLHVVNGFVEVLRLNGQPGWIEENRVKPFDPTERCVPSIMSNGRPGIG